jgi:hypothetical protein
MPTVAQMIQRSMRLNKSLGAGETPTAQEYTDMLYIYNSLLDSINNESNMLYYTEELTLTLTPNDAFYTIGSGGNINSTRPLEITGAFVRDNNIDYQVVIINKDAYDNIFDKTTTSSYPNFLFYDPIYPLAEINLWPVPSQTAVLHVDAKKQLTAFASTSESLALPPGYQAFFETVGAVWAAPEFEKPVSDDLRELAIKAEKRIKNTNTPDLTLRVPPMINGGERSNIFSG